MALASPTTPRSATEKDLGVPIKFVGTGERPEHFEVFDPAAFVADLTA